MIAVALLAIAAETTLPSGVTLIHVDRRTPYPSFAIAMPFGSDADPEGKAGLAHAAAIAVEEKIRALSSGELPRAFEHLGGSISVRTGPTASIFFGGAPADRFEEAMAIIFRGISDRAIDEKTVIARAIAERRALASDPAELARFEARRSLQGIAPPEGEVDDLQRLTRDDLVGFLSERTKAGSIYVAVAGDAALIANAEAWTSSLPQRPAETPQRKFPVTRGRRVIVIDRDDPGEALIVIARSLPHLSEERLPAMLAAAAALDVAGAHAELDPALGLTTIAVHVSDGAIAKTTRSALGAIDKSRHGPSKDAITVAKKRAATRADVAFADPSTHALAVLATKIEGRPVSSRGELAAKILAAGDAEIAIAARNLTSGDELAIVVVASATQELVRELAGIPGVRDVSIVSSGDR